VQDAIDQGKVVEETGKYSSRNSLQNHNTFISKNSNLMRVLVERVVTRKKQSQRAYFFGA
jgi:hypothetical protein